MPADLFGPQHFKTITTHQLVAKSYSRTLLRLRMQAAFFSFFNFSNELGFILLFGISFPGIESSAVLCNQFFKERSMERILMVAGQTLSL